MSEHHPVTFGDAKYGAVVLLDDGREGVLQFVTRYSRKCKVRVGNQYVRVDSDRIVKVIQRGDEPRGESDE